MQTNVASAAHGKIKDRTVHPSGIHSECRLSEGCQDPIQRRAIPGKRRHSMRPCNPGGAEKSTQSLRSKLAVLSKEDLTPSLEVRQFTQVF
jgi:hypothetical protein